MIDLCIALNGPLVDVLLPITMSTLLAHNDLSDVTLHFVNKDCAPAVVDYVSKLKGVADVIVYQMPEPPAAAFLNFHDRHTPEEMTVIRDVAWTCQWMLENCGHQDWAFISHFDIQFKGPLLHYYRGIIEKDIGQIGAHNTGLVGYRRKAVQNSDVGFHVLDDCYLVREDGRWKIRHARDPRCCDLLPVHGWDVGELLELGLQYKHWRVISETETQLQKWRIHNGSGCGRCADANQMIRERSLVTLAELGLEPIR